VGGDDLGKLEGNLAHLRHVRASDAILHRPSDRRPELERGDTTDQAWKIVSQNLGQPDSKSLARRDVLGDDHRLGEEVVRQLQFERNIERTGAPPPKVPPRPASVVVLDPGTKRARPASLA